ncbi:MAG: hypothetical protein PHE14_07400 [Aminobacterium colombiense]|nr:hypothetical protein [Aminobacterium colombiense]MDD4266252.1 hypothetical protein [Aminobacterium colombiense]
MLLGLVLPGYAEKVYWVYIPKTGVLKTLLDLVGGITIRILHLLEGGYYYVALLGSLYCLLEPFLVNGQIDHSLSLLFVYIRILHLYSI